MSDLDHHVIKGRGKNRGMYLCHAWQAELPSGEFVWLPEQRKAARWSDPQYGGRYTHQADVANKYDGYFVRLIAPKPIDVNALQEFIAQHANGAVERLPCHWFGADFHDPGEDFCRECAERLVDEKYKANPKAFTKLFGECESAEERYGEAIDGGWWIEHDSPPYCETCGTPLEGSLTEYGMSEEIEALTGEYAPSFRDANSWATLSDAVGNLPDDHPLWRKIARLVEAAKKEEAEAQAAAARLAASPGMPEARATLLGMLSARAVQKAPEPSFRLWDDLKRYRKLPFEATYKAEGEVRELQKRLLKEADAFAELLGYQWKRDCIDAPYGCYIWHFVVEIEQYELWQPPAFLEGRAYRRHPCPSGNPKLPHLRGANPYPESTEEHTQWDCGYISAKEAPRG